MSDSTTKTTSDEHRRTQEFLRLLGQCERHLNSYILSLMPDWSVAEEISQETLVRLWEQFDRYDPQQDFGKWARTIAYYQVLTYRKKASRTQVRFSTEFVDAIAVESAAVPQAHQDARFRALSQCLEKLPSKKRELLRCCYANDGSIQQAAETLGRTYEATRKGLLRVRAVLADCVERTIRREEAV